MKTPKILVSGKFLPENISLSVIDSSLEIGLENRKKIEKIWSEKEKEALEKRLNFYDGLGYRLEKLKLNGDRLDIKFSLLEFKQRYGIKEIGEYLNLNESFYPKGCYCSATVKTSDGNYVMVELSGKSTNKNKIDLLGGVFEDDVPLDLGLYLFNTLFKELEEEAHLLRSDIKDSYLRTVYLSKSGNIGFYFEIELSISSVNLKKKFKLVNDIDIKNILFFNEVGYRKILREHNLNKQLILGELSI